MAENRSQKQMVLDHLRSFGSIEPLTALREYGCYRLGAAIFKLRAEGYDITSETMQSRSRITGRTVRYSRYTLHEGKGEKERTRHMGWLLGK